MNANDKDKKIADAIIKILRGEVHVHRWPRVRELTDAEVALARTMKEIAR